MGVSCHLDTTKEVVENKLVMIFGEIVASKKVIRLYIFYTNSRMENQISGNHGDDIQSKE